MIIEVESASKELLLSVCVRKDEKKRDDSLQVICRHTLAMHVPRQLG